jgi:hypothetical protein
LANSISTTGSKANPTASRYQPADNLTIPKAAVADGIDNIKIIRDIDIKAALFRYLLVKKPMVNREWSERILKAWKIWDKAKTKKAIVRPGYRAGRMGDCPGAYCQDGKKLGSISPVVAGIPGS